MQCDRVSLVVAYLALGDFHLQSRRRVLALLRDQLPDVALQLAGKKTEGYRTAIICQKSTDTTW
jgi:hypothetical protein